VYDDTGSTWSIRLRSPSEDGELLASGDSDLHVDIDVADGRYPESFPTRPNDDDFAQAARKLLDVNCSNCIPVNRNRMIAAERHVAARSLRSTQS
jgi:hypothetical protein